MDPADSTARALKRRRLYNHPLDQPQFQPQYADSGRFDGEWSGTQTAFGEYGTSSCSVDRVNDGIDAAELRAIEQDDSVECCYGMVGSLFSSHSRKPADVFNVAIGDLSGSQTSIERRSYKLKPRTSFLRMPQQSLLHRSEQLPRLQHYRFAVTYSIPVEGCSRDFNPALLLYKRIFSGEVSHKR
jgi:hypothetical protein